MDAVRVFDWVGAGAFVDTGTQDVRGLALAVIAGQLRGVATVGGKVSFFPNVDGVMDIDEVDHDDIAAIGARLACSINPDYFGVCH